MVKTQYLQYCIVEIIYETVFFIDLLKRMNGQFFSFSSPENVEKV